MEEPLGKTWDLHSPVVVAVASGRPAGLTIKFAVRDSHAVTCALSVSNPNKVHLIMKNLLASYPATNI